MFCPKCKSELPEGSKFCLKCGHGLASNVPNEVSPAKPLGWIALGLGIAVALFLGWHTFAARSTAAESQPTASASSPASVQPTPVSVAAVPQPVVLSTQTIFQEASGGMILIQTFDDEGHMHEQGSGFVVAADGTALTNYHVIRGAVRATAKFGDGTWSEVNGIVAFDVSHDVAVIRLASPPKTVLRLGDSDDVKVGQNLVAIGSPLGFQNTVSEGIVSGLRNGIIQMSDPVSPGSSGGAVFDSYGNVVGMSVATAVAGQNLNFAVPINWAKPYLNSGTARTFADVTAENTVTNDVLDGSVTVPAQQLKQWNFMVNPNAMSNAKVQGQVSSTGGMDGKITLALFFGNQQQPIYSCNAANCVIDQKLVAGGNYILVLDNRNSPMFARTVSGKLSTTFVK
ncbi:MAG: trypsin-like peptidase domain-containing protein [Candidatus Acidiferrales bacterium]